jgi:hypothetical protein
MLDVTFTIRMSQDEWLDEPELADALDRRRDEFLGQRELEGAVVIRFNDEPEVRVLDALVPLGLNVCFDAACELAQDRNVALRYYSWPGSFRIDPEGWWALISGDGVPSVRVWRRELQEGLVACGDRITDFLRRLGGSEADDALDLLVARAEETRGCLGDAPKAWPGTDPATIAPASG